MRQKKLTVLLYLVFLLAFLCIVLIHMQDVDVMNLGYFYSTSISL